MDGQRFDDWARRLAANASRRGVLRGLLGSAAAGALSLAGVRGAGAVACRPPGDLCRENANCCSGLCARDATGRRVCQCQAPTVACGRSCVDPTTAFQSDPNNCGSCGNRCPRTRCQVATCSQGTCGLAPDPAAVGLSCNDGDLCTVNDVCTAQGTCAGTPVVDGTACPGGLCCGGTCVVGVECCSAADCPTGQVCLSNGTCAIPCPNGNSDCAAAACSGNRCISTNQGSVCVIGGTGFGSCSGSNAGCPTGSACSGVICEVVC